jgi:DNA repair exonuclease SbcCD ATPase subunit
MRGDPEQEARAWLEKLSEVDQERRGYLRLAAKGRITDEELDEALSELEDARETAERELAAIRSRCKVLEELERDKTSLLEKYARMTPAALDELTSEERHQVYRMLRLQVYVQPNGDIEIRGVLTEEGLYSDGNVTTYPKKYKPQSELRFRALLMGNGAERLELVRV